MFLFFLRLFSVYSQICAKLQKKHYMEKYLPIIFSDCMVLYLHVESNSKCKIRQSF